jgi:non-specific serine/threonine protein kinase
LLSSQEQRFLRWLATFAGGFSLTAAEAIWGDGVVSDSRAIDLVGQLVSKSLVLADTSGNSSRYRLLEVIRQYAAEKLRSSGELADVQQRHARYFLSDAEASDRDGPAESEAAWLDHLEVEHDNLTTALRWFHANGFNEDALRMAATLSWFWYVRGHYSQGRAWLSELLIAGADAPPRIRASALLSLGELIWRENASEAAARIAEALTLWRELHERSGTGQALSARERIAHNSGDLAMARRCGDEAVEMLRPEGPGPLLAQALADCGRTAFLMDDLTLARELLQEAVDMSREHGSGRTRALACWALGLVQCDRGEHDAAEALLVEALAIQRSLKSKQGIYQTLQGFLRLAGGREQWHRVMRLGGALEAIRAEVGLPGMEATVTTQRRERLLGKARRALGVAVAERLRTEGRALTLETAVDYALSDEFLDGAARSEALDAPRLTKREWEVAQLIGQGLRNREIAARLSITEGTAGRHIENILAKLGVQSRAAVAAWSARNVEKST